MTDLDFYPEYIKPSQWKLWDEFVKESPQGTIFQTFSYIQCVTEAFQRPAKILSVWGRNRIVGGVVLYPLKRWGLSYATTPYFIPYNGFLLHHFNESSFYYRRTYLQNKALAMLMNEIGKTFAFVDLHQSPSLEDMRELIWKKWQFTPEYTVLVHLQRGEDLLQFVERDQRRRIRNFESQNIKFQPITEMEALYQLMEKSYFRHRIHPPLPRELFLTFTKDLLERQLAACHGIFRNDEFLSAVLTVEDFPTVYALFSGKTDTDDASSAELYLFWKIIQYYRGKSFQTIDFLGAMVPSIAKIKMELGGVLQRSDRTVNYRNKLIETFAGINNRIKAKQRQI